MYYLVQLFTNYLSLFFFFVGVIGWGVGEAFAQVQDANGTFITVAVANGTAYFNVIVSGNNILYNIQKNIQEVNTRRHMFKM